GTDSISLSAIRRAPESPLFPYTTLFRSIEDHHDVDLVGVVHPLEVMLLVSPPGTLPLEDDPLSGSALLDHVRPCHRLDLEVVVLHPVLVELVEVARHRPDRVVVERAPAGLHAHDAEGIGIDRLHR